MDSISTNYVWLAYAGAAALAVVAVLFLQRKRLLGMCSANKSKRAPVVCAVLCASALLEAVPPSSVC